MIMEFTILFNNVMHHIFTVHIYKYIHIFTFKFLGNYVTLKRQFFKTKTKIMIIQLSIVDQVGNLCLEIG